MQGSAYFQFVSIECCDKVKVGWACTLYWGPVAPLQTVCWDKTEILQPCVSPSPPRGQLSLAVELSVLDFLCLVVHLYIGPFVHLSICPLVHLPICSFLNLFIGPFVHMCICQLFHWSILVWDDYSDIRIYSDIHLWFVYTDKCIPIFISPKFMIANIFEFSLFPKKG